jgi:hypothetical protein
LTDRLSDRLFGDFAMANREIPLAECRFAIAQPATITLPGNPSQDHRLTRSSRTITQSLNHATVGGSVNQSIGN